jgi:hypothetical protein
MNKRPVIFLLIALLSLVSHQTHAETSLGAAMPFYLDTDLDGGAAGGYGINAEYASGPWFVSYTRLQNAKRRDGGEVTSQDFITGGYRYHFQTRFFLQAGVAINERSDVLGSPASFNIGAGYQWDRYRITWAHWSNANTNEINHGFDALTLSIILKR